MKLTRLKGFSAVILLAAASGLAQAEAPVEVFAATNTVFGDSFQSQSYEFTVGDVGLPRLLVSLFDNEVPTPFQYLELAVTRTGGATVGTVALDTTASGSFAFDLLPGSYTAIVFGLPGATNLVLRGGGTREVFAGTYGVTVNAVPEPGTYALLLAGLGMMAFVARRRMRS